MIRRIDTSFLVQFDLCEIPGHDDARAWLNEALAKHPQLEWQGAVKVSSVRESKVTVLGAAAKDNRQAVEVSENQTSSIFTAPMLR
jgi:hypothetical protein